MSGIGKRLPPSAASSIHNPQQPAPAGNPGESQAQAPMPDLGRPPTGCTNTLGAPRTAQLPSTARASAVPRAPGRASGDHVIDFGPMHMHVLQPGPMPLDVLPLDTSMVVRSLEARPEVSAHAAMAVKLMMGPLPQFVGLAGLAAAWIVASALITRTDGRSGSPAYGLAEASSPQERHRLMDQAANVMGLGGGVAVAGFVGGELGRAVFNARVQPTFAAVETNLALRQLQTHSEAAHIGRALHTLIHLEGDAQVGARTAKLRQFGLCLAQLQHVFGEQEADALQNAMERLKGSALNGPLGLRDGPSVFAEQTRTQAAAIYRSMLSTQADKGGLDLKVQLNVNAFLQQIEGLEVTIQAGRAEQRMNNACAYWYGQRMLSKGYDLDQSNPQRAAKQLIHSVLLDSGIGPDDAKNFIQNAEAQAAADAAEHEALLARVSGGLAIAGPSRPAASGTSIGGQPNQAPVTGATRPTAPAVPNIGTMSRNELAAWVNNAEAQGKEQAATMWNCLAEHVGQSVATAAGPELGLSELLSLVTPLQTGAETGHSLAAMLREAIADDSVWATPALATLARRMPELCDSDRQQVLELVGKHLLPSNDVLPAAKSRILETLCLTHPQSVVSAWQDFSAHVGRHAQAAVITALCLSAPEDGHRLLMQSLDSNGKGKGLQVLDDATVTTCAIALWVSHESLSRELAQEHQIPLPEGSASAGTVQQLMAERLAELLSTQAVRQTAIVRRLGEFRDGAGGSHGISR